MGTHDTWLLPVLWADPSAHMAFGLPVWGLGTPQHTRGAWAALLVIHARAPLGDTWRLGHVVVPKVPES